MNPAIAALLIATSTVSLYPDKKLSPGRVNPAATKAMVCTPGYSATVRGTTLAMKKEVFRRYSIDYTAHAGYEVDHIISLELGGADVVDNLWPEPYCPLPRQAGCYGAREKDVVETSLHRSVCKGEMTLKQAQKIIANDWYAYYLKLKAGK